MVVKFSRATIRRLSVTVTTTRCQGFSLLELMVTTALMATLITATAIVLRCSQEAWEAHEQDHVHLEAAHATLRHLTRQLRQANTVLAISDPSDSSGTIAAEMPGGEVLVWEHMSDQVRFGISSATDLLAEGVTVLSFSGFEADGVTTTSVPAEIRSVQCTVAVELPRENNALRTFQSRVWIRSW